MSQTENPTAPGKSDEFLWKSRLQEYVLRASFPPPIYKTSNEGSQHAPQFRSEVCIDGMCFMSQNTFSIRKMAEQDAAKHAFVALREKINNEVKSRILQSTVYCKSILNEYVAKTRLDVPTYETSELRIPIPQFVSSLVLNGIKFVGDAANNKKDAEQLAARSAIMWILDNDPGTTMSETANSKFRMFDSWMKANAVNAANMVSEFNSCENSLKICANDVIGSSIANTGSNVSPTQPCIAISQNIIQEPTVMIQHSNFKALSQSTEVAIPPQTSSAEIAFPVLFVIPDSGKKRKRKNKKKKALSAAETILQKPVAAGS